MKIRIKWGNVCLTLLVLILIIVGLINPVRLTAIKNIEKLNYSETTAKKIIKMGLKDLTMKYDYSSFVDKNINEKEFDINNYEVYLQLSYKEEANDLNLINKLINKGYNAEEVDCIIQTGDYESINLLLNKNKYENILKFLNYDFALLSRLDRYIEYKELNVVSYDNAILNVNMDLDKENYQDVNLIEEFSFLMLVNKHNKLSVDLKIPELEVFSKTYSYGTKVMANQSAIDAFVRMSDDYYNIGGVRILANDAYRSFDDQQKIVDNSRNLYGDAYVNKKVALAGHSDHQTGLGITIVSKDDNAMKWVSENAYKYGFILRFPYALNDLNDSPEKNPTGFNVINNYYRYVGVEAATYMKNNNICFEEYYAKFLVK